MARKRTTDQLLAALAAGYPGPSLRARSILVFIDVAAQEVVVALAERLRVAALARLRAPRGGEIVETIDELLGLGERRDERARAVLLHELDAAVLGGAAERQDDGVGVLVADRPRDHHRG